MTFCQDFVVLLLFLYVSWSFVYLRITADNRLTLVLLFICMMYPSNCSPRNSWTILYQGVIKLVLQFPAYIYIYIYTCILYKRLEASDNHTIYLSHWISKLLNIIYVWKSNQTVLELDFRAVKFLFFPRRDLNPHHWYTAASFA